MNIDWAAIIQQAFGGLFGAGVLIAVVSYLRDRRSIQAKGAVAVGTVDVQIDVDKLALLEGRMTLLNATFDAERAVKDATIAHLRADLEVERMESEKKDRKIAELVTRVEEIQASLDAVKKELAETHRTDG